MKNFIEIITNKYLWITLITVALFYFGNLYVTQTSKIEKKAVAAKIKLTRDLYGVDFPSSDNGWIVGEDGLIAHTVDKGKNWKVQQSNVITNLVAVHFLDTEKGFAAGSGGTLLMTVNGGGTWAKKETGTVEFLNDIYFTNNNSGFVVGNGGLLLFTKDGGETWHRNASLFKDAFPWEIPELHCIYFNSPENGWIVGEFGKVLRTADGGLAWNMVDVGTENTLYGISFLDQNSGHIVGAGGFFLATGDGGKTWDRDKTFTRESDLYEVAYRDYDLRAPVYMAGKGELIFALPTVKSRFKSAMIDNFDIRHSWLFGIDFVSSTQAYAVGKSGLILHISRGEGDMWAEMDYNFQVK